MHAFYSVMEAKKGHIQTEIGKILNRMKKIKFIPSHNHKATNISLLLSQAGLRKIS